MVYLWSEQFRFKKRLPLLGTFSKTEENIEAYIGGLPVTVYPISLEKKTKNRKVSHIPLSKLENIPIISFPKYHISLEGNKNIPEITDTKCENRNILSIMYFV